MTTLIFDIDGTLLDSGKQIPDIVLSTLINLHNHGFSLILVGGATYTKICWQIRDNYHIFTKIFAECGTICYYNNTLIESKDMITSCDQRTLINIIQTGVDQITKLKIPCSDRLFDFRKGLAYISPIGILPEQEARNMFSKLDNKEGESYIRRQIISQMSQLNTNNKFDIVLGGQSGIAVYPTGWDKSQIMKHFDTTKEIHFFGDNTEPDGNDYTLYTYPGITGHSVKCYSDTVNILQTLF